MRPFLLWRARSTQGWLGPHKEARVRAQQPDGCWTIGFPLRVGAAHAFGIKSVPAGLSAKADADRKITAPWFERAQSQG